MSISLSPAAERNKQPILEALLPRLPANGLVLEIASGTGQHVTFFAAHFPKLTFQPSDTNEANLAHIAALTQEASVKNILPPMLLDVSAPWPSVTEQPVAVFCANMIHIAPWDCAVGLFAGVGSLRVPLFLYGPFRFHGAWTAPSNEAFDQDLRGRNPAWGVRDLDDLTNLAHSAGLGLSETVALPSNNHLLVWRPQ